MLVFAVSANKINIMDSCWKLYDLNYNGRWTPNENDQPLDSGTVIHTVLAHFYREKMKGRLRDPQQFGIVLDEATNKGKAIGVETSLSVADIEDAIRAVRESLIYHKQDGMEVHAVEEPFSRILYEIPDSTGPNGEQIHGIRILWEGKVDLIATLPNQPITAWDHKSESRRSNPNKLDNQFEGTAWAFNVETIVINKVGLQTSVKPEEKFRRVFLEYSSCKEILQEWREDVIKSAMEAIERHRRAAQGRPDWPRNRTSCNKFSGCRFRAVCGAKPAVRTVKLQTWYHIRPEHELYVKDDIVTESSVTGVEPE